MKRLTYISLLFIVTTLVACNNSATQNNSDTTKATAPAAQAPISADPEGLTLIKQNDCTGCHNAESKVIGPSYTEIAAKYTNTIDNMELLSGKIMNGSNGVWGTVPMPAHPGLDKETAKKMMTYIMSLKK
ncbi:MAG: c-type cytochrome [Taibaiella sp.]|nr:c-type cytochrome [Taibaiella sp.]